MRNRMQVKSFLLASMKNRFAGKVAYQKFFRLMRNIACMGMNYWNGNSIVYSGEVNIIKRMALKASLSKDLIVLDVGAHEGEYTRLMLQHFPPRVYEIYSF
jgi:hypothetical protein